MEKWWDNYQWRVIQTNMRECDIKDLDPVRFVDDLVSFHANTVMVSFGGTLANYPSTVPNHYINPDLNGDPLSLLVELCHEKGIKVIARTDFSKMHNSIYALHPEWAYREGDGEALESFGYFSTCQNGGFQKEFMDSVITEILTRYPVDGIYCNMSSFMVVDYNLRLHGPCHCDECRKAFKEMSGFDIPEKDVPFASPKDPAVAAYQVFKSRVTAGQKKRVEKLIHSINPNVAYCSVDYVRLESNTEIGKNQIPWQYSAGSNIRAMKGCGKVGENASVDMMGFSARFASVSPALHEYRLWQALASFGGLDFFTMGRLDNREDKSSYERVKRIFEYAEKNEEAYKGYRIDGKVLLVRDSYNIPSPEERGWVRYLSELHIPFSETLTQSFNTMDYSPYSLIILPDKARLSVECTERIDQYVENGGKILVSGKASPNLKSLGIEEGKFIESEGAYIKLPLSLPSLESRYLIPIGKGYFDTKAETAESIGVVMPPQRFGPPEVCYAMEEETSVPGFTINSKGKGKAVRVPWQMGSIYYNEGYDLWLLTAKALLVDVLGVESISETLSPMVQVTLGKKEGKTMVQFVNGSGHFGNSFFDPVEIEDATVEIPWEGPDVICRSLYEKDNILYEKKEKSLKLTVKKLGFYEAIEVTEV